MSQQKKRPQTRKKKPTPKENFPIIHRNAAGIDIGSTFHVAAISEERDSEPVRTFQTFTGDLHLMADWLVQMKITTVAMESTGIYWIPAYEILEARGIEVLLVNARFIKNVPGQKTDIKDAQWIQQLHQHGLLRGSFRPTEQLVSLREYLRHRESLMQYRASHIQHMQKALMQMNLQLHHVVTDITGVTGMRILHAILKGERNQATLASFRDPHCKSSKEEIQAALVGNYRPEHLFSLQQAVELYEVYTQKIAACDQQLDQSLQALNATLPEPADPLPPRRTKTFSKSEPDFDVRAAAYTLAGVDLSQIHGIGPMMSLQLLSECGDDMSRWPTAPHFTSWLCLCPGSKISGGKVLDSRTRRSQNRAAGLFRMAAQAAGRTDTALGAFYRRLGGRIGKAKANTATARKIAILFYNTLRYGLHYEDPGENYYEEQHRQRVLKSLQRRAKVFGYHLVEVSTGSQAPVAAPAEGQAAAAV